MFYMQAKSWNSSVTLGRVQIYSLGDDTAEERNVQPEVLGQRVQTAHGSEVHQAVGGLLTVLHRNAPCWAESPLNTFKYDI